MKKLKIIITSIFVMLFLVAGQIERAYAASFSISGPSKVSPGQTFSVSVSASGGEGAFSVSASGGATVSNSSLWSGESTSITAPTSGTFTVTVTCSTFSTNEGEEVNLGSKSLTVTVNTPSSGGNNGSSPTTPETPEKPVEDTRSKDSNLSSLTVSAGTLTPEFNKEITEYSVNLDSKTTKLTIGANATDANAIVSGIGEKEVVSGENIFEIVVTAENKSTKKYTVKVNVDETPTVFQDYSKEKLGVVKNVKDLVVPIGFEETTVTINGEDIKAWTNGNMNKTIVYMINENNEKNFYLYDNGITSIFKPMALLGRNVYIVDIEDSKQKMNGLKYQEVTIDGNILMGWIFENKMFSNYSLISVMNEKGEMIYYQYEVSENTLQLYDGGAPITQKEFDNTKTYQTYTVIAGGIAIFMAVISIILLILCIKYKKANTKIVNLVSNRNQTNK